ncbi:MAG: isoprenylcysteine carboxylmethyltransferase family protein [Candidatus Velthaea sp.]
MDDRSNSTRTAGVAVPPPLLFAGALISGLVLDRLIATPERAKRYSRTVGALSLASGIGIGAAALAAIKRVGSNVDPFKPTTALATTGVFRVSRNPAYVGATAIYIGIALLARSLPAFTFLPIALALLDRGVVDREERYLEDMFGEQYRAYRSRVPRWF